MSEEEIKSVKVVLLGESCVGKTCIISRFVNNMYDEEIMEVVVNPIQQKKWNLNFLVEKK